ncbi:hypothetical protein K438DRAFT_2019918 [Mycena galopus ATCC 62051]|nr:hypothetical protein K438DRAFT_2019918 [Mycena galopus ATCC 62051]
MRSYVTTAKVVNIVEVRPRDGLQNEKDVIPVSVKAELVSRLGRAGVQIIEAGSFQDGKHVLAQAGRFSNVRYPVLVPNQKGLVSVTALLAAHPSPPLTNEIAIFTATTDAFTHVNLAPVARAAHDHGLRVRGYDLIDMDCYEVSLGDTVGMGTTAQVSTMLEEVTKRVPVQRLAGRFHDRYGTAVARTSSWRWTTASALSMGSVAAHTRPARPATSPQRTRMRGCAPLFRIRALPSRGKEARILASFVMMGRPSSAKLART